MVNAVTDRRAASDHFARSPRCYTPFGHTESRSFMEELSVRLVVLLLVGVLVVVLTLHAPVAGAAVVGATAVVALLAQLMTRD